MSYKISLKSKKIFNKSTGGRVSILTLLFSILFLAGCEDNTPLKELQMKQTLAGFSTHAGVNSGEEKPLSTKATEDESKKETETTEGNENGWPTKYITTTEEYKASAEASEQLLLNPGSDVIYLGSVLRGDTIADGTYVEVTTGVKKKQTASYSLTGDGVTVKDEFEPNLASYRELHSKIVSQKNIKSQSIWNYDEKIVTTEEEFDMNIAASAGYNALAVSAGLRASLNFNTKEKRTNYVIRFMQTYYTVDLNQGKDTFLYKSINAADFNKYRPVYVSTLAYGRLAYMTISTTLSSEDLKTALNLAIDTKTVTADLDASVSYKKLRDEANTKITVIGGNEAFTNIEDFRNFIKNSQFTPENTGIIISYKLRFVDNNKIANTVFAYNYKMRKTEQIPAKYKVTLTPSHVEANVTDHGSNAEFVGQISAYVNKASGSNEEWIWKEPTSPVEYHQKGNSPFSGLNGHDNSRPRTYTMTKNDKLILKLDWLKEDDLTKFDYYGQRNPNPNEKTALELSKIPNWFLNTGENGKSSETLNFVFNVKTEKVFPE